MNYAVEVIADSSEQWAGNAIRFPGALEAEAYAKDLYARWTAVRSWRIVFYVGWAKVVVKPASAEAA